MKKAIIILGIIFISFIVEFLLSNYVSRWFRPNILLLLVIFFNLYFGIRYGVFTAVVAGLFKDSFGIGFFGVSIFSFVLCAYVTTIFTKYIYQVSSNASKRVLVFTIVILNIFIQYILYLMTIHVSFLAMVKFILLPETITTVIIATYIFEKAKKCVLRFYG